MAASCGALILLLVLTPGGVFAVRALSGDEGSETTQAQEESAEESADGEGEVTADGEETAET